MRFLHPGLLLFLLSLPLCLGFYMWNDRIARRKTDRFIHHSLMSRLTPSISPRRIRLRRLLLLAALILIIVAAARPQYGTRVKFIQKKGVDIAIAIDTSESMRADDMRPSRFHAASHAIRRLVEHLSGDRVGLIGFSGDAFIQSPLTRDYGGFLVLLDSLRIGSIPLPGTNLEAAIDKALQALQRGSGDKGKTGAILIVTDGENTSGDLDAAIRRVKDYGSVVFALGVGTEAGTPIPAGGSYKKDREGNVVISRLDGSALERLANETGGRYFALGANEAEIDDLIAALDSLDKSELLSRQVEGYAERFQWFLAFALLLLAAEATMSVRR